MKVKWSRPQTIGGVKNKSIFEGRIKKKALLNDLI